MDIVTCKLSDRIKCVYCNLVSQVSNLKEVKGHAFPNPKKPNTSWQTVYRYCPFCGDPFAKVFDWGDGRPLELTVNAVLVSLDESEEVV